MDLLEQPMEAVAFRIHSLPEVAAAAAAAWTCLAAVLAAAAAAGLWRLRSYTPADFTVAERKPLELDRSPLLMTSTEAGGSPEMPPEPMQSSPAPSPKERYTAYYHDSSRVGCCVVEGDEEEEDRDREDDDGGLYGAWETDPFELQVVRPLMPLTARATADKIGRYRSPRALSGSVVRLWDQGAEWGLTAASARLRGRAGTVSSF